MATTADTPSDGRSDMTDRSNERKAPGRLDTAEPGDGPPSANWPAGAAAPAVRDRLVRLAYRFVWNLDDAEEVVQDAMATAFERSGQIRDGKAWWSWLCRIVVHGCYDHGRRRLRRQRRDSRLRDLPAARVEPVAEPERNELRAQMRFLISDLPRRQRDVIVLRHLEGMAFDRIGEILGMAPETARSHARTARETLGRLIAAGDGTTRRRGKIEESRKRRSP